MMPAMAGSRLPHTLGLAAALLAVGPAIAQGADPLASQRLERALARLEPQRPGIVDAYVVVAALDTDPVFGREARETGRVLARRFDAARRTLVLAEDEAGDEADGAGVPRHLARALARAAELMDRSEDVLVLYTTSHGSPNTGLDFEHPAAGVGFITPAQLSTMLSMHGFVNRLIILQACFSGRFVPALAAPGTVVATSSSAVRSSFGCTAGNDWTFFGHALINQAMRKPESFARQFRRAWVTIDGWERQLNFEPSNPQISIGSETSAWLAALDSRAHKVATAPVGRPPSELAQ